MSVQAWMSWEGGVDLVALSQADLPMPNIIVHFARMVHTPVGSAPAGMILLPKADNPAEPAVMGFVSPNPTLSAYFGPNVFAGTPFEAAPALEGNIEVTTHLPEQVSVKITVAGFVIESTLSELGALEVADRAPGNLPFHDHSIEAKANQVLLTVNGQALSLIVPPFGMSGGPAAVWSPCGSYSR